MRPATEYAAGHLPGAVKIPIDQLAARLGELPADVDVVAYFHDEWQTGDRRYLAEGSHGPVQRTTEDGRHQ